MVGDLYLVESFAQTSRRLSSEVSLMSVPNIVEFAVAFGSFNLFMP